MSYELLPVLKQRFFDANGAPLAGGKLYSYIAGTSTPSSTYQDAEGVTPNTNPIILDGDGYATVYINVAAGAYKFVLKDVDDNTIFTQDNIQGSSVTSTSTGWSTHAIADGQTATNLIGETVDGSSYSSAVYDVEITRGTTILSVGQLAIQFVNTVARVRTGTFIGDIPQVSFSVSQAGSIAQLQAAANAGPGTGEIKLSRRLVPA